MAKHLTIVFMIPILTGHGQENSKRRFLTYDVKLTIAIGIAFLHCIQVDNNSKSNSIMNVNNMFVFTHTQTLSRTFSH
jgi:hypothetical protein